MVEVSFAADILTMIEAQEFNENINSNHDLMITSCCCPIWVCMIKKDYNSFIKYTTPTVSPMIACGRILKKLNNDCTTVFISPCVAKKKEAKEDDIKDAIDYVITFEELNDIFSALSIRIEEQQELPSILYAARGGLLYPTSGGICEAVSDMIKELYPEKIKLFKPTFVSGVKNCKEILNNILTNDIDYTFVEGLACDGGCVGGPKVLKNKEETTIICHEKAYSQPIKLGIFSPVTLNVLEKVGINNYKELNIPCKSNIFHRKF